MQESSQKKGLSKTAESLVSLVAGPMRLEVAASGVIAAPKCTPPCDFKNLEHTQND
jgi:hypothetical protein